MPIVADTAALHPDLAESLVADGAAFIVQHPLVVQRFEGDNAAYLNRLYAHKLAKIERAVAMRDIDTILIMYERPYRFEALCRYAHLIHSGREYWERLRGRWLEAEQHHHEIEEWLDALTSGRADRAALMSAAEHAALAALPETFTIWRGATAEAYAQSGLSWTLDRDVAAWFARRFTFGDCQPYVAEARVQKADVLAHFLSVGNENEIVVDPADLLDISVSRIEPKPR